MPLYGSLAVRTISPGDQATLLSDETVATGDASIAVAVASKDGAAEPVVAMSVRFDSAPTAVVVLQGALTDSDASYVTLATSTSTSPDLLTVTTAAQFLRAKLVSQSGGGGLTAVIRRSS